MPGPAIEVDGGERESAEVTRRRLIGAFGELIEDRGYRYTTVVDIVRVAQASKRTFYMHFTDKQDCYLALLASVTDTLIARIRAEVDEQAKWKNQVHQAISAYAGSLATRPGIALSWIRDLPAMGVTARSVQRRNFAELAVLVDELSANPGFQRAQLLPITPPKAVMIVAGLRELAAQAVEDNKDLETIVAPAADIVVAILQTGHRSA